MHTCISFLSLWRWRFILSLEVSLAAEFHQHVFQLFVLTRDSFLLLLQFGDVLGSVLQDCRLKNRKKEIKGCLPRKDL